MSEALALLPEYLSAHVRLTLAALLAGVLLAVPAGVLVSRVRALEGPVVGLAGVIQTIPALALLAVMVPLLSGLGLPGIGVLPAFLGLVLYSLLPILRNTLAGLHGIDPAVIEAADGVGMTGRERLWQVELPLALPVIAAGVRTATVWTVGMATLSTPVGATSLGNYVFAGLQTRNSASILVGCAAAAALALALDFLVRQVAAGLGERRRGRVVFGLVALVLMAAWAWGVGSGGSEGAGSSGDSGSSGGAGQFGRSSPARGGGTAGFSLRAVRVGGKTFTEQYVLAEILAETVRRARRDATVLTGLGSTVAFDALARGEIDLYVDYTGTLWSTVMHRPATALPRERVLDEVRAWLLSAHGIRLAAALGFENAYCFAVRRETADSLGLRSLGDLARHAGGLVLASDYEFLSREEWRSVQRSYGLSFRDTRTMDPSLLYQAIAARQVDVVTAYTSDGRIDALGLVVLEDDQRAIPPYDAVVLAGPRIARESPEVMAAVSALEGRIDAARMRALNRMVDEQGKSAKAAALEFLK